MNITLRQLKAFVAISEQKSFTKAARLLSLTQSALSGLIKELEQNLGVTLFDRTTRTLHLSDAGTRLLPQALRILNEVVVLNDTVTGLKNLSSGMVRVAASQQLSAALMPRLIHEFSGLYPDIQVTLVDTSVTNVVKAVQHLEVDLGVAPECMHGDDIVSSELFSSSFYLVMPPKHPLAQKPIIEWQELLNERLITLKGPFIQGLENELPREISERIFSPDYQINYLSTALNMTSEHLGVTLCLLYAHDWVEQHNLCLRPLASPVVSRKFLFYRHKHRILSPASAAFLDFLIGKKVDFSPKL